MPSWLFNSCYYPACLLQVNTIDVWGVFLCKMETFSRTGRNSRMLLEFVCGNLQYFFSVNSLNTLTSTDNTREDGRSWELFSQNHIPDQDLNMRACIVIWITQQCGIWPRPYLPSLCSVHSTSTVVAERTCLK